MLIKLTTSHIDCGEILSRSVPELAGSNAEKGVLRFITEIGIENCLFCYMTRSYNDVLGEDSASEIEILAFSDNKIVEYWQVTNDEDDFLIGRTILDHKTQVKAVPFENDLFDNNLLVKGEYFELIFERVNQNDIRFTVGSEKIVKEIQDNFNKLQKLWIAFHTLITDKKFIALDDDFEHYYLWDVRIYPDPLIADNSFEFIEEDERQGIYTKIKDKDCQFSSLRTEIGKLANVKVPPRDIADLISSNFHLVAFYEDFARMLFNQVQVFGHHEVLGNLGSGAKAHQNPIVANLFADTNRQYNYYLIKKGVGDYKFYSETLDQLRNLEWALSHGKQELKSISKGDLNIFEQQVVLKHYFIPNISWKLMKFYLFIFLGRVLSKIGEFLGMDFRA